MNKQEIKALIKTEDPIILEIGANNGTDTIDFLRTFDKGLFFCFEPDPRALKQWLSNVSDQRAQIFNIAISDKIGTINFNQSSGWPPDWEKPSPDSEWNMSGSIMKPKNHIPLHPWCKFNTSIIVNTITLDEWCENMGIKEIDFAWVDVQGAESKVLTGGRNTFKTKLRYLYTEYSDDEQYEGQINKGQLLKMLPNYSVIKDFGGDILLKNEAIR